MESEDNGPIEAGRDTPEEAEDKADEEAGEMAVEHATIPDGPGDPDEAPSAEADPEPWVANPEYISPARSSIAHLLCPIPFAYDLAPSPGDS